MEITDIFTTSIIIKEKNVTTSYIKNSIPTEITILFAKKNVLLNTIIYDVQLI